MTIFAARRVVPPLLMTPAKASKPFMKETGPLAVPPPASDSVAERMVERLVPVPLPYLKSMPSVLASVRIDSIVSSTLLMKHADTCGLARGDAEVEPHRAVEAHLLMQQQVGELVLERGRIGLGGEVAAFAAPLADGVRDARDHLLDAGLATRRAELAAEVLADHDICGHL